MRYEVSVDSGTFSPVPKKHILSSLCWYYGFSSRKEAGRCLPQYGVDESVEVEHNGHVLIIRAV